MTNPADHRWTRWPKNLVTAVPALAHHWLRPQIRGLVDWRAFKAVWRCLAPTGGISQASGGDQGVRPDAIPQEAQKGIWE